MSEPDFTIPDSELPEGFAASLGSVPEMPAEPRPAATVVVVRDGRAGLEVLLLRRTRSSGFVPGAYVFPGGRVDRDDRHQDLIDRLDGLTPAQAGRRLELPDDRAIAFYLAAIREAFEETGFLIGRNANGEAPAPASESPSVEDLRRRLLEDQLSFTEVLDAMSCRIAGGEVAYIAHWITPVQEPRRYDTRFFLAEVPSGVDPVLDEREMIDAKWVTPDSALARHERGELPMVFPTIKTLQSLSPFEDAAAAASAFRSVAIPSILPRLVRTPTGVGIEIPERLQVRDESTTE